MILQSGLIHSPRLARKVQAGFPEPIASLFGPVEPVSDTSLEARLVSRPTRAADSNDSAPIAADAGFAGVGLHGRDQHENPNEVVMAPRSEAGLRSAMERTGIEPVTSGLQTHPIARLHLTLAD
jgi:hypothetical protein